MLGLVNDVMKVGGQKRKKCFALMLYPTPADLIVCSDWPCLLRPLRIFLSALCGKKYNRKRKYKVFRRDY